MKNASAALESAMVSALTLFGRPDEWRAMMRTAMARDFSWAEAGGHYLSLYRSLLPA